MHHGSTITRTQLYESRLQQHLAKITSQIGFTPAPYNVPAYSFIAVKNIEEYKHFNCTHYEKCLYIACLQNWNDFSCRNCPVWKAQNTKHRLYRKTEPEILVRFIRRVKLIRRVVIELGSSHPYEQLRLL